MSEPFTARRRTQQRQRRARQLRMSSGVKEPTVPESCRCERPAFFDDEDERRCLICARAAQ